MAWPREHHPRSSRTSSSATLNGVTWVMLGLTSVALVPCVLNAQPSAQFLPDPPCSPSCLAWDTIARLGDRDGPGIVFQQSRIAAGPDGEYFLTSLVEPGVVRVFNRDGDFLERFGRPGQGPGEYVGAPMVLPDGTALLLVDDYGATCTRLDRSRRVESVRRLPFRPSTAARVGENQILLAAPAWSRERIGLPLHIFDCAGGQVLASFGGSPGQVVTRRDHFALDRVVAAADSATFWAARRNRFLLEHWSTDGSLLGAYERAVDWFEPWVFLPGGGAHTRPPPPMIQGVSHVGDGLVWILAHVPALDWAPTRPDRILEGGMESLSDMTYHKLYDSVVELWRVTGSSAEVLASDRIPLRATGFVAPGILYIYEEDQGGFPRYLIVRPYLQSGG